MILLNPHPHAASSPISPSYRSQNAPVLRGPSYATDAASKDTAAAPVADGPKPPRVMMAGTGASAEAPEGRVSVALKEAVLLLEEMVMARVWPCQPDESLAVTVCGGGFV